MGWWQLGARARELCEGIPEHVARRWMRSFLSFHEEPLSFVPTGVSWSAASALGGVGLPLGPEIPEPNLKTHTRIACLSDTQRQHLLAFPSIQTKSWFDQKLADSEKYYEQWMSSHYEERDRMDLILENWGFPVTREKSNLGSALRIGFVLDAYMKYWTGLSPAARLTCAGKGGSKERELEGAWALGKSFENRQFESQRFRLGQRLTGFHYRSQNKVCLRRENKGICTCERLHLMSQEKARTWVPPVEKIIDWESILPLNPIRFNVYCDRGMNHRLVRPVVHDNYGVYCSKIQAERKHQLTAIAHISDLPSNLVSWETQDMDVQTEPLQSIDVWGLGEPVTVRSDPTSSKQTLPPLTGLMLDWALGQVSLLDLQMIALSKASRYTNASWRTDIVSGWGKWNWVNPSVDSLGAIV
jgi:hypothetical protein